ncbi:MAG TPA: class I SAM-dependent methyltransferase [Bryobacteraceae bacterium]|nr:class I SAM-dependent methyltransferase [Bryobacteraceae bacterium]HXJ43988.1 class I SAM-dependent methyltransferase [Bryobacteraceae bacterium]
MEKSPYALKSGPYSSHTLALQALPKRGEGRWVLDVGCAAGYAGEILAVRGYRVVGVDRPGIVPERTSGNEMFVQADLDSGLPVLGQTFDFVLCLDILEHLRDPLQLLGQITPLLSPDGVLIASLPNSGNIYFRLNVLLGRFPAEDRGLFDRTHLHFYTWAGWLRLFSQAGFRIQSVKPSSVPVALALGRPNAGPLVGALETAWYWLARIWKKLFAYQFIVVAKPRQDHE